MYARGRGPRNVHSSTEEGIKIWYFCMHNKWMGPSYDFWLAYRCNMWLTYNWTSCSFWCRCGVRFDPRSVMHRPHAAHPSPPPPGFSGDPLLMGRLQLPPSIPVSKDGEEGAYAYHLSLLHSNAESRPERYHAPPNRTLDPRGQNDDLGFHSNYATSTTTKSLSSSSSSCSGGGTADSKTLLETSDSYSTSGSSTHFCSAGKPMPHVDKLPTTTLWGSHEAVILAGEKSFKMESKEKLPAAAAAAVPKQRSSSAEGVRRIISKYSFLRNFSRKYANTLKTSAVHSSPPQEPPPPLPSDAELCEMAGVSGVLSEAGSPPAEEKQAPWELPPNYVDMIFIKDTVPSTAGGEKQGDVARKQQHLRQHLLEQQQHHHQLNKSTAAEKSSQKTKAATKQK